MEGSTGILGEPSEWSVQHSMLIPTVVARWLVTGARLQLGD